MRAALLLAAASLLVGCGGEGGSGTELESGPAAAGFSFTAESSVAEGKRMEPRFTCDGENVPPTLVWDGVPEEAQELALVLEDPDAPRATFTHWLVYGIDPSVTEIAGTGWTAFGVEPAREGENDFGDIGYGGPCPPDGEEHRYVFRLLALHAGLELDSGAGREDFDAAVAPHVLAEARMTPRYARG